MARNIVTKSISYGSFASATLLGVYFAVLTFVSGWNFAQTQFWSSWYFITSLAVGFGIQIGLYQYLRLLVRGGYGTGKVVGVSGTTSTVAMISCCTHYLVNLVPMLGLTGLVMFAAQYQVKLFLFGIILNIVGIAYITKRILKLSRTAQA